MSEDADLFVSSDAAATGPSFAARLWQLADERGDEPAISFDGETLAFAEMVGHANAMAKHYLAVGAKTGDFITVAEPNSHENLISTAACWLMGAVPQPVSARLPASELAAIIELADPAVVVGAEAADDAGARASVRRGTRLPPDLDRLDDVISPAWKAPTSGGSTGRPKLIVSGDPSVYLDTLRDRAELFGSAVGETMVMPGPLYHNGPFIWAWQHLLLGGHLQLLGRFDAEATMAAVQETQATSIYMVPTMMQRIWKLPDDVRGTYDLSSLRRLWHLAEPCPAWLKHAWIDWLGPDVIWELYGGTEGQAATVLSGHEWLQHEGSVGRTTGGEIKICDDDGNELPPGETGEVWMRAVGRDTPTYHYIGAEAEQRDGWECLGDIGWMDADGFLYLADRRTDMILVGGANVYPAEIEAAINQHPAVRSSAVIGLPDDDKGSVVHAIVDAPEDQGGIESSELATFLADHLVIYKIPRSFEFVDEPLRDDAGKVRRSALRAERVASS